MEDEETKKKLQELEERRKVLKEGEKDFKKGERVLGKEEQELKKKLELEGRLSLTEKKITGLDNVWKKLFGDDSGKRRWIHAGYALALVLIFIGAIYLRTTMTKYWGFYEPDNWYDFSIIRAAVNNNFFVPAGLSLSGWPIHSPRGEPAGEYWTVLLPYFFLRFLGVSYYTIMRYISVVFGILDVIGAYFLARFLSKDKFFLLLVMALVALSAGDAARTSALIFRGDSFVTFFLIVSLITFIYIFKSKETRKKIICAVLSGLLLALCYFVWNGSDFVMVIYLLSFLLALMIAFVKDKEDMLKDCGYVLASLLIFFALTSGLILAGQISTPIFSGTHFLVLYIFLVVGWYAGGYILRKKYFGKTLNRFLVLAAAIAIGAIGLIAVEPGFVYGLTLHNSLIVTSAYGATIQELTPPTYSFLFASFGYALYTSPMAIMMTLPAVVIQNVSATSILRVELDFAFWVLMLLCFIPYLFMRVYDSEGFLKGNARVRFGADIALTVLMAYFAITAFLQIYAIRFNSLIAVPLAIFGAYTIYWITLLSKRHEIAKAAGIVFVFLIMVVIMAKILAPGALFTLMAFAIAVAAAGATYFLANYTKRYEVIGYAVATILILAIFYYDLVYSSSVTPADSMNPQLYAALGWLKNNSAPSSVVLTLWPDGSVVEGVANRTSITDSVGSQLTGKSDMFADWILNSSDDPKFLTGNQSGNPNYLVVRYVWLYGETQGIFEESGINASAENSYAYAPLESYNEQINASTNTQLIKITNGQGSGAINVVLEIHNNTSVQSYINSGNGEVSPFAYIAFNNEQTGNFTIIKQTAFNVTNNQMLMIEYSEIPNPQLQGLNITNAVIFAPGMADSNLLKFLYFCNAYECEWSNNVASMKLVYANQDTKIFQISYNKTS